MVYGQCSQPVRLNWLILSLPFLVERPYPEARIEFVPGRVEDRPGVGHGLLAVGAVPDEAVGEEGQGGGGVHEGPAALVLVAEGVVGAPVNAGKGKSLSEDLGSEVTGPSVVPK